MTLEQQWGIKPLELGSKNLCLDRQPVWPHRLCNSAKGHTGDTVIETWWPRSELRSMTGAKA
jgi:hypothetical protein